VNLRCLFLATTLVTLAPPAPALDIFKFDPAVNLRFSRGTYADVRLEENPAFLLAGHDLSGVGWSEGHFGVTLVSPRHFLTAAHAAPLPGSTVSFRNRAGLIKHYVVESDFAIEHAPGVHTDLVVGRLATAIPAEDQVSFLPALRLARYSLCLGLRIYSFGAYQSCGTNTITGWGACDLLPFAVGDQVTDDIVFQTQWTHVAGEAQAQGHDSGSPTFTLVRGRLALIGTHSAVHVSSEPYVTVDVLIPAYFSQIAARLALDGYEFLDAAAPSPPASPR